MSGGAESTAVTTRTIAIVGGGIGGLTAALALGAAGHTVTVIERRTGFSEVGAGLQISPNASRVLIGLGLGAALRRVASEPPRVAIRDLASGRAIGGVALGGGMRERFGAPYWVVHRADLQTVLLDAVRGRPGIRLLVGRDVADVQEDADGVTLTLRSVDAGRTETLRADMLIAADGVRSQLRARFDARPLAVHRQAAWRAMVPRDSAPPELRGDETGLWLGAGRHVVHYPIAGGQWLNLVAIVPERVGDEDWGRLGEPAALRAQFATAAAPLRALLDVPDTWVVWSLVDRRPAAPMAKGRIALLGDAAHPILPFLAQGAALAIEDAAELVRILAEAPDAVGALATYAEARRRRVARVQRAARANGRTYHAGALVGLARNVVMARLGPAGMGRRYDWLYGWTPGAA